jgi:hypothetical protein
MIRGAQRDEMRDFELHRWFSAEELVTCSACGKRAAIDIRDSDTCLCLECGHVEEAPERPVSGPKAA